MGRHSESLMKQQQQLLIRKEDHPKVLKLVSNPIFKYLSMTVIPRSCKLLSGETVEATVVRLRVRSASSLPKGRVTVHVRMTLYVRHSSIYRTLSSTIL